MKKILVVFLFSCITMCGNAQKCKNPEQLDTKHLQHCLKSANTMVGFGIGFMVAGSLSLGASLMTGIYIIILYLGEVPPDTESLEKAVKGLFISSGILFSGGIPLLAVGSHRKHNVEIQLQNLNSGIDRQMAIGVGIKVKF